MNKALHNFFSFTSRERNGIIILLVIMFGSTLAKLWTVLYEPGEEDYDTREIESLLTFFESRSSVQNDVENVSSVFLAELLFETPELFFFDPNTANEDEMARLGMNKRVIRTLLNYREAGGRFRIREDLKKIYGITAVEYAKLEPYIRIGPIQNEKEAANTDNKASYKRTYLAQDVPVTADTKSADLYLRIDLNKADTSELMHIKGIGPVLAGRIVKYRALLGGYCNSSQLKEVYGISDSLFNALEQFVYADATVIESINMNTASEQQLSRHPYIGSYFAEGIIQYRKHVNKISGIEELIKNNLLPENKREIIEYYLAF
ncbi:MAG: helix-hairpin-helix domain-containing protein [Bacteroidales bacterium]|nr:helix-hairpin-helix domain-containing protein [Bacteroidales bacterium]